MKNLLKFATPASLMFLAVAGCASRPPAAIYAPPPPPRAFPPGAVMIPPGGAFPSNVPPQGVPPGSGFPTAPNLPQPGPQPVPQPPPGVSQGFPVAPNTSSIPPGEPLDRVGYRWEPYTPQQPPQTAQPPVNTYSPPPVPRPSPLNDPLQGTTPPTQPYTPPPAPRSSPLNDPLQGATPPTQPYTPPPPPPSVPPLVPPGPPMSTPAQSDRPEVYLLPPRPDTDPKSAAPKEAPKTNEPPTNDKDRYYPPEEKKTDSEKRPAPLPVGIFGYDKARENVHTGQRPTLEGLDWLQKNGYKTVVFLHAPGDMTDTDREQVEKRGMTFVAIEINAKDLHKDSVERFLRIQAESKSEKIFVYDVDGSLAGAMWYLSFRLVDRDGDETARVRSNALGQNEMRDSARDLWGEVRRYVEMK